MRTGTIKIGIVLAPLILVGFAHTGASFAAPLPGERRMNGMIPDLGGPPWITHR
jgi:hypothetical protein